MASFQDLIPVVNKLQDIVTNTQLTELDLPVLSVIGSQSCGKSSVLENIVGRDFLPRGTGIVTRRPLVLQLIHTKEDSPLIHQNDSSYEQIPQEFTLEDHLRHNGISANNNNIISSSASSRNEWGEFLHMPNKRFYNFSEIRKEIENETARIAGKNKGISRLPINLKIFSPNVLNLTLVDLPGLTKIPIGDQPSDIERQTRNLILEYISKPNAIILAVSPANVDLVNSESLKLARQVDPQGKRTVGILSKLDLMDQGTNALDILTGRVYPLKLGFIGIVNRSQQDIAVNKSLDESLQAEEVFFKNHPVYKNISNRCGTHYLAKTLNNILMNHIREKLPDIKAKLNTLMGQTEQELASYGDISVYNSKDTRGALVLTLMTKFATNFVNSIEGTSLEVSTKELCGGARIYYIYNEVFGQSLTGINPTSNLSVGDIRTAIRNSTGPRPSLFVPELAFDLLVKPQIKLLEGPSHRCVELVYEELMKIVHNCSTSELSRYPKLKTKLIEVVSDLLRERLGPTTKYVESLIEIHRAYINTNHPNFVGAAQAMSTVLEERKKQKEQHVKSENEKKLKSVVNDKLINGKDSKQNHFQNEAENAFGDSHKKQESANRLEVSSPSTNSDNSSNDDSKDSFLNYFFGKDQTTQQQQEQTQAQLNPKPFHFPSNNDTLQFQNLNSTPDSINLEKLNMNETSESLEELSEREQLECELIRRLIISYFSIVREMIQDQVPKSIMCLLVNYCKEQIQNRLVSKLYNESYFEELLFEDESLQQEREKCEKLLNTYKEAANIISDVI